MINKKYLIIGLIAVGLILLIYSIFNRSSKNIKSPDSGPVPTVKVNLDPTKNRGSLDPDNIFPTVPPKIQAEAEAIRSLRNRSPFSQNNFTVKYDYHINKFVITFSDGKNANNIAKFNKWLKDNNYGAISSIYFNFP